MKTLTPGTKVRLANWKPTEFAAFDTVRHFWKDIGNPDEAFAQAVKRGNNTAFAAYGGSAISANPAFFEKQKTEALTAVTLEPGEIVHIEGEPETYMVKAVPHNLDYPTSADPIHFVLQVKSP